MNKPRILFILPFLPYPLNTGGNQAMFNGIKAICNDFETYITFEIDDTKEAKININKFKEELGRNICIIPFEKPIIVEKQSIAHRIHILLWKIKMFILSFFRHPQDSKQEYKVWQGEYKEKDDNRVKFINGIINKYNINIVQCEMLQTAAYALTLPPNVKKLFVHHEIGFVREQLNVKSKSINPDIHKEALEIHRKNEVDILNRFDVVITLSEIDTKKLKKSGVTIPIKTSFAIVNYNNSYIKTSRNYHILSFVGPSYHNPNVVGIQWFLKNCWNNILKIDSKYQLQIIGKWDKKLINDLTNNYKNIYFKGFVEDLASSIKDTIMIVPITVGSGIRMKILEACLNGVPVVSTYIGAEGLPLINGEDCLLANNAKDFINAIIKMKDTETRLKLITSAREKIISKYSIKELRQNRKQILEIICS